MFIPLVEVLLHVGALCSQKKRLISQEFLLLPGNRLWNILAVWNVMEFLIMAIKLKMGVMLIPTDWQVQTQWHNKIELVQFGGWSLITPLF